MNNSSDIKLDFTRTKLLLYVETVVRCHRERKLVKLQMLALLSRRLTRYLTVDCRLSCFICARPEWAELIKLNRPSTALLSFVQPDLQIKLADACCTFIHHSLGVILYSSSYAIH